MWLLHRGMAMERKLREPTCKNEGTREGTVCASADDTHQVTLILILILLFADCSAGVAGGGGPAAVVLPQ
jgi:hypothetical protein